jgi:ribosome recycling factor
MAYSFEQLKKSIIDIEEWLKKEFAQIRTGRATPIILDAVKVESYGSQMAIRDVAGVTIEDSRTLRIVPWDMSQVKSIEKGIIDAGLGLSVSVDDKGLRVIFPELTAERRTSLAKIANQKHEEARIRLRMTREEVKSDVEAKMKSGSIGEDEKFRYQTELQKHIDEANKKLDELAEKKEQEILS